MKTASFFLAAVCLLSPLHSFADGHGHAEHGAEYDKAKGLELPAKMSAELGVVLQSPQRRLLRQTRRLEAVIVSLSPKTASVKIRGNEAANIEKFVPAKAKLLRKDYSLLGSAGGVEFVFQLPDDTPPREIGNFVPIAVSAEKTAEIVLPKSAILDSAEGKFVYAFKGGYFKKTAVKTGIEDGNFCEITEGIIASDKIVVAAVDRLRLVELRLVNGGSHSH